MKSLFKFLFLASIILPTSLNAQFFGGSGQVLVGEDVTSQTLRGTQFQIENRIADLRETIRLTSNSAIFKAETDQFIELYDRYINYSLVLYPDKESSLLQIAQKSQALIDNLRLDYEERDFNQAQVTFRLLETTWREYLSLTEQDRIKRSFESSPLTPSIPMDWNSEIDEGRIVSTTNWTLLNGQEIAERMGNQISILFQDRFKRMDENNLEMIDDMQQASIVMRDRVGELALPSRSGFVQASLRLEVISENLREYYEERDFHSFRRQLQLMGDVLQQVDEYYDVRKLLED